MRYVISMLLLCFILFASGHMVRAEIIDSDNDGLSDELERTLYHTDPLLADTDEDGFSDAEEIASDYSPLHADKAKLRDVDSDTDGLTDDWEIALGTDLTNPDTDKDTHSDGEEVMAGYDPNSLSDIKVEKKINVSISDQTLTYTFNGKILDSFKISSGTKYFPTPKGNYTIMKKVPVVNYVGAGYSYPKTKWNLLFVRKKYGYYIHGAYWHDKFGQPMSHGCVNVRYADMERLYNWADTATKVFIQ